MPDLLPVPIDPAERISRYLLVREYFNNRTRNISPQAFKPANPKIAGDLRKTSVYRTEGLSDVEVWTLGSEHVTKAHSDNLPVLARADLLVSQVLSLDLSFDPDGIPHPRHANIVNWPDSQEARQMKAVFLAKSAQLLPR